jgi:hypothetical protein
MRTFASRSALLAGLALVLLLPATQAPAYVIVLKDGTRIEARDKPVAQGKNLVFVDKIGTRKMIPADEVDPEKTKQTNTEGVGDAYVLNIPEERPDPSPRVQQPSLSEFIQRNQKAAIPEGAVAPPPPAPPEAASKAGQPAAAAPAVLDSVVSESFGRALETAGIRGGRLNAAGTGSVRLQAITDTEQQVFAALGASARGLKESRAAGKVIEKMADGGSLYMASKTAFAAALFFAGSVTGVAPTEL